VTTTPMSGRRAQAARNDERILAAARAVFVADPGAPVAAVAERAEVGISALYRRYPSKEDLLRRLCADGLALYVAAAEAALADSDDAWESFARFLHRVVDADTHSLTTSLAGMFTPTAELSAAADRAAELTAAIVARARAAGVLRDDVVAADLGLILEQLAAVRTDDQTRTRELRDRYLALLLDGLRAGSGQHTLPGPAPRPREFTGRWERH